MRPRSAQGSTPAMPTLAQLHQRVGRHVVVLRPGLLIVISVAQHLLTGGRLQRGFLFGAVVAIGPSAEFQVLISERSRQHSQD